MANIAILIGNISYRNLSTLECCHDDLISIKELLEATKKYNDISVIEDADADSIKTKIRIIIDNSEPIDELFFYFTGHGYHNEVDFFFCPSNFDVKRPNETGVSTAELHTLLRLANANLIVKVIDACNSGTSLIKSDQNIILQSKDGFKNIIQIASCLDSQYSLTGDPLSLFTEKFRDAAFRKTEGIVYYTDIINTLRDEFMNNDSQTPFFISQHTGREQFVDDAKLLDDARKKVEADRTARLETPQMIQQDLPHHPTLLDRLRIADSKVAKPDVITKFVGDFFNDLTSNISNEDFTDFFEIQVLEHPDFKEDTSENFIISILSKEKRGDNFVTAEHSRRLRRINPLGASASIFNRYTDDDAFEENWYLSLNCRMEKCQIKISFTPKFLNLQRVNLVVSCAPSLNNCYIFEVITQHMLSDFGKFDPIGPEASKRWWKLSWGQSPNNVVKKISEKLIDIVHEQLENAEKRLPQE